jgi:hypothetical protein
MTIHIPLACRPIYPQLIRDGDTALSQGGMTYRQWLIGMCVNAYSARIDSHPDVENAKMVAKCAINLADAILLEMESREDAQ